ncbi:CPBP family intramembrane glutamic endopeptidase [Haloterrigena alkaliphila]|uniref:CPBP family intramembrane metalloprotease n=1 Tax=Haloterrigena alkaliphila TaxID=2816475 RepID=A0A8A2VI97_9EURY|nr:type II CAAX endopeptidase family protein [Haloterrigena alkaliphila]QSW97938.1 CPBP family intramembrane metalloprotease [Haloterrigena alkaliphila]
MSDIARTADADGDGDAGPAPSAVVPTVGTVLSGVILAAIVLPVRRGVDDPAVWVAGVAALVATVAFVGRRHGLLERAVAGPIAAGGSLLVVVCTGYAITQGVLGSVALPGLEGSVSALFVAFFVGMAAVGVGVADRAGIAGRGLLSRLTRTVEVGVVALVGLLSISIAALFLSLPVTVFVGEPTELQATLIQYPAYALGLGGVAAGYLAYRGHDRSFIDLEAPTPRTVGWIVGGLILIVAANVGIAELMAALGIESSEHTTTQRVAENPDLLVIIVPSMILFVGPFEELLYRNVIQKSLYERFSRAGAVAVGSVVFTLVHVTAYATAGPGELLASLSLLFVLALILGAIYERTENLLVPALVHGCYNALIFVDMFL